MKIKKSLSIAFFFIAVITVQAQNNSVKPGVVGNKISDFTEMNFLWKKCEERMYCSFLLAEDTVIQTGAQSATTSMPIMPT